MSRFSKESHLDYSSNDDSLQVVITAILTLNVPITEIICHFYNTLGLEEQMFHAVSKLWLLNQSEQSSLNWHE